MTLARVAVIARKAFDYRGQSVAPEDVCLVRPIEAAALLYRSRARWPREDEVQGIYDRRDMVARPPGRRRRPKKAPAT